MPARPHPGKKTAMSGTTSRRHPTMLLKILIRLPLWAAIAAAAVLMTTACGPNSTSTAATHRAPSAAISSLEANPTASADVRQAETIFGPCFKPTASNPAPSFSSSRSCAEGKVPALQDKGKRRGIEVTLGECLARSWQKEGYRWSVFRQSGWQACGQSALTSAEAAQ